MLNFRGGELEAARELSAGGDKPCHPSGMTGKWRSSKQDGRASGADKVSGAA